MLPFLLLLAIQVTSAPAPGPSKATSAPAPVLSKVFSAPTPGRAKFTSVHVPGPTIQTMIWADRKETNQLLNEIEEICRKFECDTDLVYSLGIFFYSRPKSVPWIRRAFNKHAETECNRADTTFYGIER